MTNCVAAGRSTLVMSVGSGSRNRLAWRWSGSDLAAPGSFGDPTSSTGYALCLYDHSGGVPQLKAEVAIPAGSTWVTRGRGFSYRDRDGASDGVSSVRLSATNSGTTRLAVKARGASLPTPAAVSSEALLAADPEVVVQLISEAGGCWQASYSDLRRNSPEMFAAR
jgi:hypothetical protein